MGINVKRLMMNVLWKLQEKLSELAPIHAPASDLPMSEFRVKNLPHFVNSCSILTKQKLLLVGVVSLDYSAEGKVHYLYRCLRNWRCNF